MDPNANVDEQFRLIDAMNEGTSTAGDAARLEELRDALLSWRLRGGFLPDREPPTTRATLAALRQHDARVSA